MTPDARAPGARPGSDTRALNQTLAAEPADPWSRISMYGALGLVAAGAGIWMMRRRRSQLAPDATIEIIAQRSLGGKARIVWLCAGQREMLVSVTAQQVRMLGQWRKTDAPAALPTAHAHTAPAAPQLELPDRFSDKLIDKALSPAVSGILRLRGRTSNPLPEPVGDEVATEDIEADALWAKEILAATGARR